MKPFYVFKQKEFLASLFFLLINAFHGVACMCDFSEPNFYLNLNSNKPVFLVEFDSLKIGFEEDEVIGIGRFKVVNVIHGTDETQIGDTLLVFGSNGINCGEVLSQFNRKDSLIITLEQHWSGVPNYYILDGCNTCFLKVENGKCKELHLNKVFHKIDYALENSKTCGCGMLEFVFDFYSHIENEFSYCLALFKGFNYDFEENNHIYQTGCFTLLDTIININLPIGNDFVVLGENGINCGEMFEKYESGDSLVLALERMTGLEEARDTFFLQGTYCGEHSIGLLNARQNGMSYNQIKSKINSIKNDVVVQSSANGISIYPNPFEGSLNIKSDNACIHCVKVFDLKGRLVLHFEDIETSFKTIMVAQLPPGAFLLEIQTSEGIFTEQVVKL